MSVMVFFAGLGLLVAGAWFAIARVVRFTNVVFEDTRRAETRHEVASAWHGAAREHLPGVLVGVVIGMFGAALLGWFAS